MSDVVVTVPRGLWWEWLDEGQLPGDPEGGEGFHFWLFGSSPDIAPGERVYVVAHNRLRGYAPLVAVERPCRIRSSAACLLRRGGAVALTIPEPIRGFRGWRTRWWDRRQEVPFPHWQTAEVRP